MLIKKMVWTLPVTYLVEWSWWLAFQQPAWKPLTLKMASDRLSKHQSQQQSFSRVQSPTWTFSIKAMLIILLIYFFKTRDHFSLALHCMVLSKKRVLFNFVVLCFQWNFADIFPSSIEKFQVHHTKQYCEIKGNILASLPGRGKASLTNTVYLHCKFLIPKWLPCLSCCFSFPWRLFSINYQFHIRISLS